MRRSVRRSSRSPVVGSGDDPALIAWQQLHGAAAAASEPLRISAKSAVYRLHRALPGDRPVIAKRGRYETMRVERCIYEEVLPRLPLATLTCVGSLDTADRASCWLFLEDAGGDAYVPRDPGHRRLAARWLGLLHTGAAGSEAARALPDRGACWYAQHLATLSTALQRGERHPALTGDDRALLRDLLRQCEHLARGWSRLEEMCGVMPRTLVHADFVRKNIRVRRSDTTTLVAFDWEMAGWGTPATDLTLDPTGEVLRFADLAAVPDLDVYYDTVRSVWTDCIRDDIGRWAALGLVLRLLLAMSWASATLVADGPAPVPALGAIDAVRDAMNDLRIYREMMANARHVAGLDE